MTIVDKAKEVQEKLLLHASEAVEIPKMFNCYQLAKIIRQQILQNFTKQDGTILARIMFRN